jgi:uncharacterized protein (TIGR03435 family)
MQGQAVTPTTEAAFRVMLHALLAERFHLEFHRQTKEQSVYVLVLGKNGAKFRESAAEGGTVVASVGSQSTTIKSGCARVRPWLPWLAYSKINVTYPSVDSCSVRSATGSPG